MTIYDAKIKASMRIKSKMWVDAGKPAPGTIKYVQLFSGSNEKPHYILKSGIWWYFRSIRHCKKYLDAIKNGTYDRMCEPRSLIKGECGII